MDFSDEMIDEIFKIFQVESEEIISRLNNNILDLEKNPNNKDAITLLFRDAHSLKGASRMIGLNNVQTLAHKMEDVLGLAKENKILLNSKVVDILYKTVDFLSELIQKSISKGQDVYSEEITKQIAILDNIYNYSKEADPKNLQEDFNLELFLNNISKINELLPQCLVCLMKIEANKNEDQIDKLLSATTELFEIFKGAGHYEIKNSLENIKFKLEFIKKASNNLTTSETEEIQQILNEIIDKLASIFELHNVELVDYYSIAFDKISEEKVFEEIKPNVEIFIQESNTEDMQDLDSDIAFTDEIIEVYDLESIRLKLNNILQSGGSIAEIKKSLTLYESECENNDVKTILQKIIEILNFAIKNEIQINEEVVSVLSQGLDYCDNIIKNKGEMGDKVLIFQRLEIVQQILDFNKEKTDVEIFINPKEDKSKQITDFSEVFNTNLIKTLRVESSKLDNLVNQVNELTITKIKTKKHLHELNKISSDVEEWQKNISKVLNYLKYYEKKYTQSQYNENSNLFLTKQLLNLFSENNRNAQKISYNLLNLYRTIQEDDTKTHLVVDNLTNMIKNIRVLPLATVFHLFGRMVRDIAQEKNKKIEFEIIGSETSTDKKIIEEIKTPLIHIIRNAIDHGIETPEERVMLGKNPVGKIILNAKQLNNKVLIEIKDDGRGINITKLKEKALQKGFLTQDEINSMSNEQITNIIFAPGFSTGDEITNISGRGIGLDVVQSKISQLNGKVSVISELNKGCCVQIELPTTMSILNVFLVKSSNQTFAIPIESINTVLRKSEEEIIIGTNKRSILFNGETILLYDLSDILNLPKIDSKKDKKTILIIESNNKIIALCIDKLVGEQEIVHKKLSAPFYKLKNISGITTLISGEICLILNVSDIIKATNYLKTQIKQNQNKKFLTSNYKILLVDDSSTTRTLEKNILSKAGYIIETAENPIEAFEKMKNIHFDVIISDFEMPEMNGIEFLEKLKTDELYADIPFIMLSSIIDEDIQNKAITLGVRKYMIKNQFNQDELQSLISEILNKQ